MRPAHWLPPVAWMAVTFWVSTDSGSGEHTSRILLPLLRWLLPWATPEALDAAHLLLRKSAHVTEYAILAALWFRAFRRGGRRVDRRPGLARRARRRDDRAPLARRRGRRRRARARPLGGRVVRRALAVDARRRRSVVCALSTPPEARRRREREGAGAGGARRPVASGHYVDADYVGGARVARASVVEERPPPPG